MLPHWMRWIAADDFGHDAATIHARWHLCWITAFRHHYYWLPRRLGDLGPLRASNAYASYYISPHANILEMDQFPWGSVSILLTTLSITFSLSKITAYSRRCAQVYFLAVTPFITLFGRSPHLTHWPTDLPRRCKNAHQHHRAAQTPLAATKMPTAITTISRHGSFTG
jgi:hypothetical protein